MQSNLSFAAPAPKSLPEAVLNDRGEALHAEALRREEVKQRSIRRGGKRLQENTVCWKFKQESSARNSRKKKALKIFTILTFQDTFPKNRSGRKNFSPIRASSRRGPATSRLRL